MSPYSGSPTRANTTVGASFVGMRAGGASVVKTPSKVASGVY